MTAFTEAEKLLNRFKGNTYTFGPGVLDKIGKVASSAGRRALLFRGTFPGSNDYVKEIEKSYGIQGDFKWPMWTNHEPINTKVSKIFKPVYTLLWRQAKIITHKRTRELTDKYNLPLCGYNHHVIVIPDLKRMSEELKTTLDNIRKQLRRWISNDGPVKKLGLTTQKRDGGKTIYSLGQWINTRNDMMKRNPFFIKDQYNEWLRNIYVHSRKY